MIKATFYIGHNVKGKPTWTHAKVCRALESAFPDGFTAWEARGAWRGEREDSTVCVVLDLNASDAHKARLILEFAFQQDLVLVTLEEVATV